MSEFRFSQPGGKEPMQVLPEHFGISHGTAKMVSEACDRWLRSRGLSASRCPVMEGDGAPVPVAVGAGIRYGAGRKPLRKGA